MNPTDKTLPIPARPNQSGKANVPGLRRLWLIEARHVLRVVDSSQNLGGLIDSWKLLNIDIVLSADARVHCFRFPSDRGGYEQKTTVSVQGVVYTHSVGFDVPRDHPVTALAVQRMSGRKFIAVFEDGNGLLKLVGLPKQPLRFAALFKTNPNGYNFSFVGETRAPSWFVEKVTADLFPVSEFDPSFDYSFTS